jgi:hypothetical protein
MRAKQLVQRGEPELGLGLHTVEPHDIESVRRGLGVIKQRVLSGARFTAQDEHSAEALAGTADDLPQPPALLLAAEQFPIEQVTQPELRSLGHDHQGHR